MYRVEIYYYKEENSYRMVCIDNDEDIGYMGDVVIDHTSFDEFFSVKNKFDLDVVNYKHKKDEGDIYVDDEDVFLVISREEVYDEYQDIFKIYNQALLYKFMEIYQ